MPTVFTIGLFWYADLELVLEANWIKLEMPHQYYISQHKALPYKIPISHIFKLNWVWVT